MVTKCFYTNKVVDAKFEFTNINYRDYDITKIKFLIKKILGDPAKVVLPKKNRCGSP